MIHRALPLASFAKVSVSFKVVALLASFALAGCAAPLTSEPNDPYESLNRGVHGFNKGLDRVLIRPIATVTAPVFKSPIGTGIKNVSNTLGTPADVLNDVLQGNVEDAVHNSFRFALNATVGVAGLFDAAGGMGLERRSTDFGETLHVWGAAEGPYVELPFFGPSTGRDAVGRVVDMAMDPMGHALSEEDARIATGIRVTSKVGDRARFADTFDSILYESADSYAQSRLLYLQSRRHELGQEVADDAFIDPYEDSDGN